jgi:putative solute:sodium symporter small subunit
MANEITERVVANTRTERAMANGTTERDEAYWKANLRLILICLSIWATVSYGFGILLRPFLMGIRIGGADMGFWFAQQGSILTFLALVFFYSWRMNELDKKFGMEE